MCPSVPCTGEWGPWDTDCESITCGTSITKTRQWVVGQEPRFGGTACPVPERETCPIIPCPSDCVYNPGTDGNPEGWVNGSCREIPETCGPDGTGMGQMYQTRTVKSEAVGSGTPCGALTRNDGPECSFDTCPSVPCTGEWGPWDTDCESIACGTSMTKTRQWVVGQEPRFGGTACPVPERETCPIIPCPSDCVYNPGTDGNPEGWTNVECRDYNGTACDRNGRDKGACIKHVVYDRTRLEQAHHAER